jgi:hypothetical protein
VISRSMAAAATALSPLSLSLSISLANISACAHRQARRQNKSTHADRWADRHTDGLGFKVEGLWFRQTSR